MVSTQSGVSSQPQKRLVKVDILSYKTISANSATVDKQWIIIDAKDHYKKEAEDDRRRKLRESKPMDEDKKAMIAGVFLFILV